MQEKSGSSLRLSALARRPDEFRAFFAYHDALMEKPGTLSKAEREMIVVATSGLNKCQYCVVAHGAILRIRAKIPLIADQVAVNHRKADLTPRQRAMLDFAAKVAECSHDIDDKEYEALKRHGFSDDDAWDIAAIAALVRDVQPARQRFRHPAERRVLCDGARRAGLGAAGTEYREARLIVERQGRIAAFRAAAEQSASGALHSVHDHADDRRDDRAGDAAPDATVRQGRRMSMPPAAPDSIGIERGQERSTARDTA